MVFEAKFDIRRKIKKRVEVQFEKDINFLKDYSLLLS